MEFIWLLLIAGFVIWNSRSNKSPKPYSGNYPSPTPSIDRNKANLRNQQITNQKRAELESVTLSDEQKSVYEQLENSSEHIFVTGKAGTGKSLLLQYFRAYSKKKLVVVAPTGVAAINVGGQTIHSLFGIPPAFIAKNSLRLNSRVAFLLKHLDAVVIDEVSMVRADLMDAIDFLLRKARGSDLPFGGVQMIMFGDLYQLPPVVSDPELHKYFEDNNGGFYFFNADAWKTAKLKIIELSHIFRQSDGAFKNILNAIRTGNTQDSILSDLNARAIENIPDDGSITLATTNNSVNQINEHKLTSLPGELHQYQAIVSGQLTKSYFPTEEILRLKVGAQVMMLKNDKEKRWVNGSLGVIKSLSDTEIRVTIDGITYPVSPATWSKIHYYYNQSERKIEEEVESSFTQYPLRLAWAITIHKSQGQTYSSVIIDMGDGAFAHGQTYVALSRCVSLETLYLKRGIEPEDIIVDQTIINFMNSRET